MSLAIAIAKGLTAGGLVVFACWMVYRAGYESGHAQGLMDSMLDEHERSLQ